jgi:putative FmdB family regulatory protein
MPIYEYECQECGRVFEKIQRFSDDPLSEYECEACGRATPVKKLVSAAAFHLKGGGWYVTDFRGGGSPQRSPRVRRPPRRHRRSALTHPRSTHPSVTANCPPVRHSG